MSRTFTSVGALASFLEGVARGLPHAQKDALTEASTFALEKAKAIPGHYQTDPSWPALAEATVDDRTRKGFTPDDPLRRTGDLAASYQRHVEGPNRAKIGSPEDRALWFEMGTPHMPPRPVLGAVQVQHGTEIAKIIGRRLQRHIGGSD